MTPDVYDRRKAFLNMDNESLTPEDIAVLFPNSSANRIFVNKLVSNNSRGVLNSLVDYMDSPEISFSEFLIGESRQIKEILKSPDFERELQGYLKRIQVNEKKGLDVRIHPQDIFEFMRSSFVELDSRRYDGFLPPRDIGRRVYTGQTEQPGSNPGFYK